MLKEVTIHLLGISGSLRADSYNTRLLEVAAGLLPDGVTMEIIRLEDIPLFNWDEEKPMPEAVQCLRERIAAADAVLIATPEYNTGLSGALKNALDWASRAPDAPFSGKPAAVIGASTGMLGTARAQLQARQVLTHIGALVLPKPEVLIPRAAEAFDADGKMVSEASRGFLRQLLEALVDWTRCHAAGVEPG